MKKYVKSSYDENPLQDYFEPVQNICDEAKEIKNKFYLVNSYLKANRTQNANNMYYAMADDIHDIIIHLNSLEAKVSDLMFRS